MRLQTDTVVTKIITRKCDSCNRGTPQFDTVFKTISIRQERPDTSYFDAKIFTSSSTLPWAVVVLVAVVLLRKQLALAVLILAKKMGSAKSITLGGSNGLNLQNCDVIPNDEVAEIKTLALKAPTSIDKLGMYERKILSTLFKHQKDYFPDNEGKWTFALSAGHPEYSKFLIARSKLKAANLIGNLPNENIYLTSDGLKFCEDHSPGEFSYFE